MRHNIETNNLDDLIKTYNYAISCRKGKINIYYQDFDILYASGMVSTTKNFLTTMKKNNFRKQKVEAIRLEDFLKMINQDKIDLVKIDCEGAEIDIIKSSDKKYFDSVMNIVMETHDNYEERELFHYIKELGFTITAYDKLSGFFKTGYLFATKNKNAGAVEKPSTILFCDPLVFCGKKHVFNGTKSFSALKENNRLNYTWMINDIPVADCHEPIMTHVFTEPGQYKITLKTSENGQYDTETKNITVFKADYRKLKDCSQLPENTVESRIMLKKGINNFRIRKDLFPVDWTPDIYCIEVAYSKQDKPGGEIIYNGTSADLNKEYNKFEIFFHPAEMDILFSINSDSDKEAGIKWWNNKITPEIKINFDDFVKSGINPLSAGGKDNFFKTKKSDSFLIHHAYFSDIWTWKPDYITIGIFFSDDTENPPSGYFKYGDLNEELKKSYTQIKLPAKNDKENIIFEIGTTQPERQMKIVWWEE